MTLIASIAVQNVAFHFDKLYDYIVPDEYENRLLVGCRVMISFGKGSQLRNGVIISVRELGEGENIDCFKPFSFLIDDAPLFDERMINMAFYMKERTFCTVYDALRTMLPGLSKKLSDLSVKMVSTDVSEAELEAAVSDAKSKSKKTAFIRGIGITEKQADVLLTVSRIGNCSVKELCYFTGVTNAVVNALEKKNLVSFYDKEDYRRPYREDVTDTSEIVLTENQDEVYRSLKAKLGYGAETALLYGVTGSGKTKVYLKLIEDAVKTGKGIIVMVPEISLTPQTLRLFHARFGDKVAVFHSGLSDGERLDEWKRVKKGLAQIAVGTRSAVFAPFDELGLVIIDEEQEHTYKSEQSPRYHARNIARYRCAESGALLLLSSATPSFESYTAAISGKYSLFVLNNRFGNAVLPEVSIVDMCNERLDGNTGSISRKLLAALMENLDKGHQSILLLNRRGYNTYAVCNSCGEVCMCPNCSISLTYHKANNKLMCHYCGYTVPYTSVCESCGADDVHYSGVGTQLFEDELCRLLPQARILRMDADTTMQKYSYEEKLGAFKKGEYDIMVGTQMVAKGLDFENVTLVGVVSADSQLYNDDYKSMETTFDLLTQVIGRAGRGRYPGKAIIQTMQPTNKVIGLATEQNFEAFYKMEMGIRKTMIYPPFCNLCEISFQSTKEEKASLSAMRFTEKLKKAVTGEYKDIKIIALGPMPERIYKVNNKYRYRLIIKCKNNSEFRKMLSELLTEFSTEKENSGVVAIPDII